MLVVCKRIPSVIIIIIIIIIVIVIISSSSSSIRLFHSCTLLRIM